MSSAEASEVPATVALARLLTPEAVRARCGAVLAAGERGTLGRFRLDLDRLPAAVDLVRRVTAESYPDGAVPLHSRWRHFETAAGDLWVPLAARLTDPGARLRARVDLAVISVLLDAGAGPHWRYDDAATATVYRRSEGLAVASLRLFASGALSRDPERDPLRVDAEALVALTPDVLGAGFQVGSGNPLVGLDARARLLANLGRRMGSCGRFEGADDARRPGHLAERIIAGAAGGAVAGRDILVTLLDALNPVWPGGLWIGDVALGDVGRHPEAGGEGVTAGLVPFHKLSQWLAYSLVEPIREAGVAVTDLDGLTGLPEYRNGGLFLDTGVLALVDPEDARREHRDDGALVVEWRALTVSLLDRLATALRRETGATAETLPLGCVLQGGTWAAGRRLAAARGGAPPLRIAAGGSLF